MAAAQATKNPNKSVLARQEDGTVQLTINIPQALVQEKKKEALRHIIEELEVPGFRKGKVPEDVALKHIEKQKLYEHVLQHVLPEVYTKAVQEHSLRPAIGPRFELISTDDDKDWSVRATTCELPEINLGDYKKAISDAKSSGKIWVPGKDSSAAGSGQAKEPSREEKEQIVIKALINSIQIKVPQPLIEEEVNHKLSGLLDQLQKFGLTTEQYLASKGTKIEQIREDYARQAKESLTLALALNQIAEKENIGVDEKEVEEVIKASNTATTNGVQEPQPAASGQQRQLIKSALLRRKALESLINLT
ncbi:hypothetical protein CMO96_03400 [Candidatus Woesebacteria bacterium]|nr:hypothetical protein [Candidatus Woesebacteria bacterium]